MTGTKQTAFTLTACLLLIIGPIASAADHDVAFSSRLRYSELEDGDNLGKAASGLFRLSLTSQWSDILSSLIQIDHVETGYQNQHSDGVRFNGQPTIPDVPGTEVNQLYGKLTLGSWSATIGRQVIEFDDQRFIGSVRFWQNEQSFDAFTLKKDLFSNSRASYTYVANANRIFGDDADEDLQQSDIVYDAFNGIRPVASLGDHEHNTHLLRAEFNEWDYSKLVTYGYFIDNKDATATSNDTLGVHYRLKVKPNNFQYRLELEAAAQKRPEIDGNPTLPYFRFDAGLGFQSVELSARWEQLGAKDNVAFFTPLGSLHEFHGWADIFNTPPPQGLNDMSLKLKWRITPFKFDFRFHHFESEEGNQAFGNEFDFDIIYKPFKKHVLMLRFADFRASSETEILEDVKRVFFHYSYNL